MNVLIIMSDEHSYQAMGCSGHELVETPNLDQLATDGALFNQCYTNSPLCTPSRASAFTGLYVHQLGTWDNATPYDGKVPGISQHLNQHGKEMTSFGKLDFHPDSEYEGLNIYCPLQRSIVDTGAFFRDSEQPRPGVKKRFQSIGIRDKECLDDQVRNEAIDWLNSKSKSDEPWILNLGFFHPHFPFFVKEKYWDKYDPLVTEIPESAKSPFPELNEPLQALRRHFGGETVDEETIRRMHVGYNSLVTELDDNIGAVLKVLEERGLAEDTLVIYTSDHGEQNGNHGLWFKCCMFEESTRIPLIMRGPGIKSGIQVDNLVSLVDLFPTVCDALAIPLPDRVQGNSWLKLANCEEDADRKDFVFSEYHAHGVPDGMYMIRWRQWKYVYYVGYPPQLFNMNSDPEEFQDLSPLAKTEEEIREVIAECEKRLYSICDPIKVNQRAKEFQEKTRLLLGITGYDQGDPMNQSTPSFPVPHPEYLI